MAAGTGDPKGTFALWNAHLRPAGGAAKIAILLSALDSGKELTEALVFGIALGYISGKDTKHCQQ